MTIQTKLKVPILCCFVGSLSKIKLNKPFQLCEVQFGAGESMLVGVQQVHASGKGQPETPADGKDVDYLGITRQLLHYLYQVGVET